MDGYGTIRDVDGTPGLVHIIAYKLKYGTPPPETPQILHKCDIRDCYEEEHLYAGTNADNMRDKAQRSETFKAYQRSRYKPRGRPSRSKQRT